MARWNRQKSSGEEVSIRRGIRSPGIFILLLALAGYLLGIFWVCFRQELWIQQWDLFGLELLRKAEYLEIDKRALLFLCIRNRLGAFLLLCILSGSILRWQAVSLFFLLGGVFTGSLMEVLAIRYGVRGLLLYVAMIFPQYLCYLPAFFALGKSMVRMEERFLGEQGRELKLWQKRRKVRTVAVCFLVVITGTLLESYVNPEILLFVLKTL